MKFRIGFFTIILSMTLWPTPLFSHPWPTDPDSLPLVERIPPPPGFKRVALPGDDFGAWLRTLPVRKGRPPVRLYNGRLKGNQEAHAAVLDIDVGEKDLQQCADAVMRLRAEYLWSARRFSEIRFNFSNGEPAPYRRWKAGDRPHALGNKVWWSKGRSPDEGYAGFRRYLDAVFRWAGSASLQKEMLRSPGPGKPGEVFIHGGHPGHAVMILDAAVDGRGRRVLLLAQSYMPAQEIHILRNPGSPLDPWYLSPGSGPLTTPEWDFEAGCLRRFAER